MTKLITAGQQQGTNKIANRKLKTLLATTAMTAASIMALSANPAYAVDDMATPTGEQVMGGSASFDRPQDGMLNVLQNSQRVVINWNSFNIGAKAKTEFFQPNARSLAVNRVTGNNANPTQILGSLKANGRLMVLDRNGVFFGEGAQIDVGGIIASTGDVDTDAVMSGADRLELSNFGDASVVNYGTINVADAGLAAFVSPSVANHGIINAKLGKVAFGAGSKVTLDLYGDNLLEIAVDDKLADALIENTGAINAEGGSVLMTAQAAKEAVDNVINMSGSVDVSSVEVKAGKIVLLGGEQGVTNVTGTLNAAGDGGFVETSGANVNVTADASITADMWLIDPLTIRISNTPNSNYATISATTLTTSLNTGSVTLQTGVNSSFTAGRDNNGDILIDDTINKTGVANTTLSLIATRDILFTGGSGINSSGGALNLAFTAGRDIDLNRTITNRGDVTMTADGDVFLNSSMNTTGGNVSFNADDDIFINATLNAGAGSVNLLANGSGSGANDVTVNADILSSNNSISIKSQNDDVTINNDVTSGGGAINVFAGGDLAIDSNNAASDGVDDLIDAGAGNVNINADSLAIGTKGSVKGANVGISRANSTGRISIGAANGGLEVSQTELGRITANQLTFGTLGFGGFDNDIMVDGVNFSAFNKVVLNTMRNDSSSSQDVVFRNANTSKALEVFADDDVIFDFYNDYGGDHAATLTASGNVDFHGNTNGLSAGDLHLEQKSKIDTNGFNLTSEALNTVLDDKAVIDAEGGNISLFNNETFFSDDKDSVRTAGVGKIDIWQNVPGSIQNAIDAVQNTGSGRNTIHVGAGTYEENVLVYENNFYLMGANAGVDPNTGVRGAESIIDGGMGLDGHAFAVKNTGDNFTIDGFTLTADGNGVDLDGTDGSISNQTVKNNIITTQNIIDSDDEGIEGTNVNGGTITNNKLNVVGNTGMKFTGGGNLSITGNVLTSTDFDGIYLSGVNGSAIAGNTVNGTANGDGISVNNGTGVNVISGNMVGTLGGANNIHGDGIQVVNTAGTQVTGNQVANVTGNGIFVDPSPSTSVVGNIVTGGINGIVIDDSDSSSVIGNILSGQTVNGILVTNGSDDVSVIGNVITSNAGVDSIRVNGGNDHDVVGNVINGGRLGIWMNATGNNNAVTGNVIGSTTGTSDNSIMIYGNTGSTSVAGNVIAKAGWDGINVQNGTGFVTVQGNVINDTTGASGVAFVNHSGDGLIDGNTINGADRLGIYVGGTNGLMISGNTISDTGREAGWFDSGIHLEAASNTTVDNNTINTVNNGGDGIHVGGAGNWAAVATTGNVINNNKIGLLAGNISGDGIDVRDSGGVQITNNQIRNASGNGIFLDPSDWSVISGNIIDYVTGHGIDVEDSDHVTVSGNSIGQTSGGYIGFGTGDGIHVAGGSDYATVSGNTVSTDSRGVSLLGGSGHIVSGNTINTVSWWNSNDEGVYAENTAESSISGNHITTADNAGIRVNGGSDASVSGNDIHGATEQGIDLYNVATAGVTGNSIENTGSHGIRANLVSDLTVSGNWVGYADTAGTFGGTIYGNGIHVIDSASAQITGNHVRNTTGAGIFVDPSPYTLISGNDVSGFGTYGIQLLDSDYSRIVGNTVTGSGDSATGIYVGNSSHVTIGDGYTDDSVDRNTVSNVGTGINVHGGSDVTVDNNRIYNVDNGIYADYVVGLNVEDNDVTGGYCHFGDGTGIDVRNSSDVRIGGEHDGNNVDSFWRGIASYNNDGVTIANNTVWNIDNNGIHVSGGNDALIDSNTVDDTGNDGIYVENMDDWNWSEGEDEEETLLPNVVISNNDVGTSYYGHIGGDGIEVYNVVNSLIESNDVGNFGYYGYSVGGDGIKVTNNEEDDPTVIQYNTVLNVAGNGIHVSGVDVATIYDNTVDTAGQHGIFAYGVDDLTVESNDVHHTVVDGIHAEDFDVAYIEYNTVDNTGDDGIEAVDGSYVLIEDNNIDDIGGYNGYYGDYYGADGIHVRNVSGGGYYGEGAGYYGEGYYGYDVNIFNNYVSDTRDDGIEVLSSGATIIGDNSVYHAGVNNGGDYYGADGIHVRGVRGNQGYNEGIVSEDGFDPYSVVIRNNNVDLTYDDGIEVVDSGRTLIEDNDVSRSGFGMETYYGSYYGYYGDYGYYGYYGYYSGYYTYPTHGAEDGYGADGIHVRNVYPNRIKHKLYDLSGFDGEGYDGYDVNIIDNNVDTATDDGIEVLNSGSTLISGNNVFNAGAYYGYFSDYTGGDGIHVANVYGDEYGSGYYGDDGFEAYSVLITGNDVDTTSDDGIEVVDSGRTRIENNEISNVGVTGYYGEEGYYGYYSYYGFDDIFGADGIHVRNVNGGEGYYGGYSVEIVDNDVDTTGDDGIQVLFSGDTLIDSNTVDNAGANHGARLFGADGINVISFGGGYPEGKQPFLFSESEEEGDGYYGGDDYYDPTIIDIVNNEVNNSEDDGIEVIGSGVRVLVDNNEVSNSGDNGIALVTFGGFFGPSEEAIPTVSLLEDGPSIPFFPIFFGDGGFDSTVSNNVVNDSGNRGLSVEGPGHGDVIVFGNTMNNNPTGMYFESGAIDLTGDTNTINGGDTGMHFRPFESYMPIFGDYGFEGYESVYAPLDIVNDTIGTTVFNGQSEFYVYLDDSAEWAPGFPTVIDGTDATYDGVHPTETGNFLTLGQYNKIEGMIHDFIDEDFRGLFFFGVVGGNIDQEDIFNNFENFNAQGPGLRVTITGLPGLPGGDLGSFLAGISPAAGGEEGEEGDNQNANELAGIEPAAGGAEESCWADAVNTALGGATANFTYDGTVEDLLAGNADCQNGNI